EQYFFFFSSRRRHTIFSRDWSSDVCSSDLAIVLAWQSWEKELGSFLARVLRLRAQDERILSTFALVIALIVPLIPLTLGARQIEIGRASCREGVEVAGVA